MVTPTATTTITTITTTATTTTTAMEEHPSDQTVYSKYAVVNIHPRRKR
jgi:hypothetical protein